MFCRDRRNASRKDRRARSGAVFVALVALGAATFGFTGSSAADISEVSGSAFGHYTNVSLFGGPSSAKGPAPTVTLPANGADPALIAKEASAKAVYGPATIFGGKWPADQDIAPPSGPITVTTKGTTGSGGFVTSTVDIVLRNPPNPASPGGFGPTVPSEGDELHSTCTASEAGVTGSVRFVNAVLSTSTDESGEPKDREPIPDNPPVNYTRTGQITNVGDNWKIIFNEQVVEPGGSITVNAVHMFLLGPIAVGEQILGQVKCSARVVAGSAAPASSAADPGSSSPGVSGSSGASSSPGGSAAAAAAKPSATAKPSASATPSAAAAPPSTAAASASSEAAAAPPSSVATVPPSSVAPARSSTKSLSASPITAEKAKSGSGPLLPLLIGAAALVAGGLIVVPRVRRRRMAGSEHLASGQG